jgi:thiol-disulfide isomerase/thioredoxin
MKRFLFLLSVFFLLVGAAPKIGETIPAFSRKNAQDKEVSLSSLKGKVVLLDFWATYCKPCKAELPILDAWQQKYQKKGLSVLSINVDPETKDALEFLRQNPVKFEVLFDPDDTLRETFGNPELPTLFLLDRQGKLRVLHKGALAEDDKDFINSLEKLLQEK